MAWKNEDLKVDIQHCNRELIHVQVTPNIGEKFHCTFIYGATEKKWRANLFAELENIKRHIDGLWLVLGDFNCIAKLDERIGQTPRNLEIVPLRRCVETCGIYDLKSTGRFFTWSKK